MNEWVLGDNLNIQTSNKQKPLYSASFSVEYIMTIVITLRRMEPVRGERMGG